MPNRTHSLPRLPVVLLGGVLFWPAFAHAQIAPPLPGGGVLNPFEKFPTTGPRGGIPGPGRPGTGTAGGNPVYSGPIAPFEKFAKGPRNPTYNNATPSPYRYRNGLYSSSNYFYGWGLNYFSGGFASFPYYAPTFYPGVTFYSPYYFYNQLTPSFILSDYVYQVPPAVVYVPVPVYVEGVYHGNRREDIDDYYLNRKAPPDEDDAPAPKKKGADDSKNDGEDTPEAKQKTDGDKTGPTGEKDGSGKKAAPKDEKADPTGEKGDSTGTAKKAEDDKTDPTDATSKPAKKRSALQQAVADIGKAWRDRDIQLLTSYVDPKAKIAVYLRGRYQYSLEARDYLDATRDAFGATKTVRFELDAPTRKERGVYTLTGRHIYAGKDGEEHTVHISYVLELKEDKYYITQVGSAPDRVQE